MSTDADRSFPTELEFSVMIWKEGESFVSLCPELDVSSCGECFEEAYDMLREAVELYLENARALDAWDELVSDRLTGPRWTSSLKVAV